MDIDLLNTTQEFAAQLRSAPLIVAFWETQARLEMDKEAQLLLTQLQGCQQSLAQKQQEGADITEDEIDALRRLQREAQDNSTIMSYIRAQQRVQAFLSRVNLEISRLLGFDFGALARAGGN